MIIAINWRITIFYLYKVGWNSVTPPKLSTNAPISIKLKIKIYLGFSSHSNHIFSNSTGYIFNSLFLTTSTIFFEISAVLTYHYGLSKGSTISFDLEQIANFILFGFLPLNYPRSVKSFSNLFLTSNRFMP